MESVNKLYLVSKSHRERMIPAKIRLVGTRCKVQVRINPGGHDAKRFVKSIVGPLDHFELDDPPSIETIIIDGSNIGDEKSHQAILSATSPEPEPSPEIDCFQANCAPEKKYQKILTNMDKHEFLDPNTAFDNAAGQFSTLTATLKAIVAGHKQSKIEQLLPWNYIAEINHV